MYGVFKYVHAENNNIIWSILSSKYAIEEAESRHVLSDVNDDDAHDNDDHDNDSGHGHYHHDYNDDGHEDDTIIVL